MNQSRPVRGLQALVRLGAIGILLLALMFALAYTGGLLTPGRPTPARFMAAFRDVDGAHPGFRRNHAKGVCVTGWFDAAAEIGAFSKAAILHQQHVPVVARFAEAGGMPFLGDKPENVRSLAVRFIPGDGTEWRTGMNDIPVFVFNSAQGFYDQLLASRRDPATGQADPAVMQAFLQHHPETARALGQLKARAVSSGFANDTYNSLNAFRLENDQGTQTTVRWAAVPVDPFQPGEPPSTSADKDYLFKELLRRLQQGPLKWHLVFAIAEAGDNSADATVAWPETRRHVEGGLLTLETPYAEDNGPCTDITYDPLVLPTGIAGSDDPLLSARSAVYARSLTLRDREKQLRPASAITPALVQGAGR
jgi:catalase